MTNEELRQLCEQWLSDHHHTYRNCCRNWTIANSCLRLLAENERMRGVCEAVRNLDGKIITIHDGEEAAGRYYATRIAQINTIYAALAKFDELESPDAQS